MRRRLLELHKALVEVERRDYERVNGRQPDGTFLELLVGSPEFAWLGSLTALIVRIDEALEEDDKSRPASWKDWVEQIGNLLTPARADSAFHRNYEQLLQRAPEVVVAHAAVMRALRS